MLRYDNKSSIIFKGYIVITPLSIASDGVTKSSSRFSAITIYAQLTLLLAIVVTAAPEAKASGAYTLLEIMPPLSVSSSQKIAQQTPIATHDGRVYVVNIEAGRSGDENGIDLHTVIRQGVSDQLGNWSWTKKTIDTNTIYDPWHTSPAVGVDKLGYVHVAYNMHNLPWQYVKSDKPNSIDNFTFLGDEISLEQIKIAKFENKTSFKTMGYAAIPGNQITYPAFYSDHTGTLFISYRFAAKPARKYESRTMSAALARYDSNTDQWQSLGGDLRSQRGDYKTSWLKKDLEPLAIASQTGWTAYHPRLAFDGTERAYIFFYWREGVAGETLTKPCIITTRDFQWYTTLHGEPTYPPVKPRQCSNIPTETTVGTTYNTIGSITADSMGSVYAVVSPVDEPRRILTFKNGAWLSEESPENATEIFVDRGNNLWAISSGMSIFRKAFAESEWETVIKTDKRQQCYPKVSLNQDMTTAYIYSQSCDDSNIVSVHALNLDADA